MVSVVNLTRQKIANDFIIKLCRHVLFAEKKQKTEVSVVLAGEGRMRLLNKRYRRQDKVTDVLAFSGDSKRSFFPNQSSFLGEIIICLAKAKKQAKKFKVSQRQEVGRLLVHCILHLLGYNHELSKIEASKMEQKEEKYLKIVNKKVKV